MSELLDVSLTPQRNELSGDEPAPVPGSNGAPSAGWQILIECLEVEREQRGFVMGAIGLVEVDGIVRAPCAGGRKDGESKGCATKGGSRRRLLLRPIIRVVPPASSPAAAGSAPRCRSRD